MLLAIKSGGNHVKKTAPESRPDTAAIDVKALHAKISELTLENDIFEGALTKAGLLSAKR